MEIMKTFFGPNNDICTEIANEIGNCILKQILMCIPTYFPKIGQAKTFVRSKIPNTKPNWAAVTPFFCA